MIDRDDRKAARIRARLSHPVVDADGHWLHYGPVFRDEIRKAGGDTALDGVLSVSRGTGESLAMSVAERRRRAISQRPFWSFPEKNTRDRAAGVLPRLLHDRLGGIGFDHAVIYATGLGFKVGMFGNLPPRPVASVAAVDPEAARCVNPFGARLNAI